MSIWEKKLVAFSHIVPGMSPGGRAALKRFDPKHPSLEFWRITSDMNLPSIMEEEQILKIGTVLQSMALSGLPHGSGNVGSLLRSLKGRYGDRSLELKLSRYMSASPSRLPDIHLRLFRFFAGTSVKGPVDWVFTARYLIARENRRQEMNVRLARSFYSPPPEKDRENI